MNHQAILGWGVLILVLWLMMRRGGCCGGGQGGSGHGTGDREPGQAHGDTAVDPICGMTVQKSTALKATVDGQDYFFCSPACRDEFLQGKGDGHGGHGTHGGHHGHCC